MGSNIKMRFDEQLEEVEEEKEYVPTMKEKLFNQ
jgi:hypothetical protein